MLGVPLLRARLVACEGGCPHVAARLCAVAPDGASALVSFGLLNLSHARGHTPEKACAAAGAGRGAGGCVCAHSLGPPSQVAPLARGEAVDVVVSLKCTGYTFPAGHRLRCAASAAAATLVLCATSPPPPASRFGRVTLSTTMWPMAWPALRGGEHVEAMLPHCALVLPMRPRGVPPAVAAAVHASVAAAFGAPRVAPPPPGVVERRPGAFARVLRDDAGGGGGGGGGDGGMHSRIDGCGGAHAVELRFDEGRVSLPGGTTLDESSVEVRALVVCVCVCVCLCVCVCVCVCVWCTARACASRHSVCGLVRGARVCVCVCGGWGWGGGGDPRFLAAGQVGVLLALHGRRRKPDDVRRAPVQPAHDDGVPARVRARGVAELPDKLRQRAVGRRGEAGRADVPGGVAGVRPPAVARARC